MKKEKRIFKNKPITEIIEYATKYFSDFKLTVGNYSVVLESDNEKILFSDADTDKKTFLFHNMMKKDVGGEVREVKKDRIQYYSFSGIQEGEKIEKCYCVDINSAYLKSLEIENVITSNTFNTINKQTKGTTKKKMSRLKSVGMFARNPLVITYKNGRVHDTAVENSPFSWVFFLACQKTTDAMNAVKKKFGNDFLLYWVDGIFVRNYPESAVNLLGEIGFESKIEEIENLRVENNIVTYEKDGKKKVLFMPRVEVSYSEYREKIKKSIIR